MPIIITKIERQKKNKQRYSLFSDDQFITGVSEESLIEFNIFSGKSISEDILFQIEQKENYVAIREQAWRFLARRMHSQRELKDKLINKGFDRENIDNILQELKTKKYLDDKAFAQLVISDEVNLKKSGPVLIKNKLLKKGIEMTLVTSLLEENYPEELQYENCQYFAHKKIKSLKDNDYNSTKIKLGSFLTQKGFTWNMINRVISEIEVN